MRRTYSYDEAFAMLCGSHSAFQSFIDRGLIERAYWGHYYADGVDALAEARTQGYGTSDAMKYLKLSRTEVLVLARIGYLKRILPRYNKSNYTKESVEAVKKVINDNTYKI